MMRGAGAAVLAGAGVADFLLRLAGEALEARRARAVVARRADRRDDARRAVLARARVARVGFAVVAGVAVRADACRDLLPVRLLGRAARAVRAAAVSAADLRLAMPAAEPRSARAIRRVRHGSAAVRIVHDDGHGLAVPTVLAEARGADMGRAVRPGPAGCAVAGEAARHVRAADALAVRAARAGDAGILLRCAVGARPAGGAAAQVAAGPGRQARAVAARARGADVGLALPAAIPERAVAEEQTRPGHCVGELAAGAAVLAGA